MSTGNLRAQLLKAQWLRPSRIPRGAEIPDEARMRREANHTLLEACFEALEEIQNVTSEEYVRMLARVALEGRCYVTPYEKIEEEIETKIAEVREENADLQRDYDQLEKDYDEKHEELLQLRRTIRKGKE